MITMLMFETESHTLSCLKDLDVGMGLTGGEGRNHENGPDPDKSELTSVSPTSISRLSS